jgi:phosphoribosyl-ATP pyrophosphohydrolase/phosphoribosyl-AMP cyclohydrolase
MKEMINAESVCDERPIFELLGLDWEKQGGMVPAVVQDRADGMVLMVGWMDPPALETTLEKGLVSFFSRTRGVPWTKGETSGNVLRLTDMAKDCEGGDTLVVLADPVGPTCSEGGRSCFDGDEKQIFGDVAAARERWGLGDLIAQIDSTLDERSAQISDSKANGYTLGLLRNPNKAAKKLGEEFMEYVMAVEESGIENATEELADFVYGALVFARSRGQNVRLEEVLRVLTFRNQAKRAGSDERFSLPTSEGAGDGNV